MKKFSIAMIALCLSAFATSIITSCQADEGVGGKYETGVDWRLNQNSFVFPPSAHPFGKSYVDWGVAFWKNAYTLGCEEFFTAGLDSLDNNVITYSNMFSTGEVNLAISKDHVLLLPLSSVVFDYPCPDPNFEPAIGVSLEEFLQAGAIAYIEPIEHLSFSFDGVAVANLDDYLFTSDLFYFVGNPELAQCYDPCITGEPQPGVHHGYIVMLKQMKPGQHTVLIHGELPENAMTWDMTLNITVK